MIFCRIHFFFHSVWLGTGLNSAEQCRVWQWHRKIAHILTEVILLAQFSWQTITFCLLMEINGEISFTIVSRRTIKIIYINKNVNSSKASVVLTVDVSISLSFSRAGFSKLSCECVCLFVEHYICLFTVESTIPIYIRHEIGEYFVYTKYRSHVREWPARTGTTVPNNVRLIILTWMAW